MKNHYDTLEIGIGANEVEIKKAFRRLAIKYHPDKNFGDEYFEKKFIEIKEAYDVLIIPNLRLEYDTLLSAYTKSQTGEEQEKEKSQKRSEKRDQREREENFHYEPFKPFYSERDRDLQDTPQFNPVFDFWGEKLDESVDFFQLPKKIGKIIGGFSDLNHGANPLNQNQKAFRILKGFVVGAAIGTIIYFIGTPNLAWTIFWYTIPCGIALWLMNYSNKFEHTNTFVGVNGFAKFVCTDNRENVTTNIEVNFRDITDLFVVQTERKLNFSYQGTDYYYAFYNSTNREIKYEAGGTFDKNYKAKEQPIELHFCRRVEQYWTLYLLDNMEKNIESKGFVLFNLYEGDNIYRQYIKLGIGYITFIKEEKAEFTYKFNEIKRIYSKGNDLFIEHINFQKSLFFFKSGNADKIPMLNLCNRQFFYNALEILLGYKI